MTDRARRTLGAVLATVVLSALAVPMPASAATNDQAGVDTITARINEARVANGATALPVSQAVTDVAVGWADTEMSNGQPIMYHNQYLIQQLPGSTSAGEVLSLYYSAEQVVSAWMNSSTHRGILLRSDWTSMGIAYVPDGNGYYYAVVDFAKYPPVTVTAVASAPGDPAASVDGTQATFSWTASTGGAHGVTQYDVAVVDAVTNTSVLRTFVAGTARSVVFAGSRGHAYSATVRAYAPYDGYGPWAQTPAAVVPALAPAPIPTAYLLPLHATAQLRAYWWASADDNGSPVTAYTTRLYRDGVLLRTDTVSQPNTVWDDMAAGHTYDYTVSAVNAIGESAVSALSPAATLIAIPGPSTPAPDRVVLPVPPPADTGASTPRTDQPATPVVVSETPPLPTPTPSPSPTSSSTPTSSPLPPATVGAQPPVAAPQPTTSDTRPARPSFARPRVEARTATLRWSTTGPGAATVDHYVLRVVGAGAARTSVLGKRLASRTLTRLARHTTYRVTIAAVDADGDRAVSKRIAFTTH